MKKTIREFLFQSLFAWGILIIVLMTRDFYLMVDNRTLDNSFARIYFISMGMFLVMVILYAIHLYRHTKSKKLFESASFEEDERELILEYKSRKTAHSFLINTFVLSLFIIGMWWNGDSIPINYVLIYIAVLFTLSQLVKTVVWIREYRK